jgi:acyl carrier protein
MAVEEAFGVSFDIDEIASMTTFERILNKTIQKTGKK